MLRSIHGVYGVIQGLAISLVLVFLTTSASAAPIIMTPNPVLLSSVDGTPDAFTLSLLSGDTNTNRLDFRLDGPGGGLFIPTAGASVMVFDNVTLTDMGSSNVMDMLFLGPASADPGNSNHAGWLALDWNTAGSAEFFVEANSAFTTATIYTLTLDLSSLENCLDIPAHMIVRQRVSFVSSAVPEPSAALVFGIGMLIAGRKVTRRR